ncbi:BF3164 family lipoprotein [Parabacteroides pacaensis]|uniref:BF3164 family lipoprotein n=1 Tax=Parabacteroides pacaensis TaxID=2086575 RepID=UPI001F29C0A4|nr:BF3164 family lipoprotein [Parabacteroides pacaensis]
MKIYLIVFILPFLLQCTSNIEKPGYKFSKHDSIAFHEIHYPEMLGITMQLIKKDSFLLINDFYGDSLIKIFNLNTQLIEKKLISKGEGPNELLSPLDIHIADDNLYILSRPIFLLNHIPFTAISKNESIHLEKDYQMPPKSDCFLPLTKTQFVFSGIWQKRYAFLTKESQNIDLFGEYPDFWEEEKDIPIEAKAMFHQSLFTKNPSQSLFASCSGYILEIYKYNSQDPVLPTLLLKKQLGKYSYSYTTNGLISAKLKKGSDPCVTEIASSKNYIYLVIQSNENKKNRDIMIIDWNGKPIKILHSNKRITCLAVEEKDKKGYCIIEDPEDKLVYFDL